MSTEKPWPILPIVGSTWEKPSFPVPTVVEVADVLADKVVVIYNRRRKALPLAAFFHCFRPIQPDLRDIRLDDPSERIQC